MRSRGVFFIGCLLTLSCGGHAPTAPSAATTTETFSFATDYSAGSAPTRSEDRVYIHVRSAGTVRIQLLSWRSPYVTEGDSLTVDFGKTGAPLGMIRNCDGVDALVATGCTGSITQLPETMTVGLTVPGDYQLRITSERRVILAYQVAVTYPR
jgi:hypothetical protein